MAVHIVFQPVDDSPDVMFVEVENDCGESVDVGDWCTREDGRVVLTIWEATDRR